MIKYWNYNWSLHFFDEIRVIHWKTVRFWEIQNICIVLGVYIYWRNKLTYSFLEMYNFSYTVLSIHIGLNVNDLKNGCILSILLGKIVWNCLHLLTKQDDISMISKTRTMEWIFIITSMPGGKGTNKQFELLLDTNMAKFRKIFRL